jgi:hypothetical protein
LLRLTEAVKTYKIAKKTIDCSFYFASRSVDLNRLYYRLLIAKQRTYSIAYKRKKKEDNNIFFIYADEDSNIIKLLAAVHWHLAFMFFLARGTDCHVPSDVS